MENKICKSTFIPIENYPADFSEYNNCTVFAWLFDKCISGKVVNGEIKMPNDITFSGEDIIELRVFDATKELYLKKINGNLKGRIRRDEDGEDQICIDTDNILWGTDSKVDDGFTKLYEERGTELTIPGEFENVKPNDRVKLIIRNYVSYNEINVAGYVDARFVKIYK